MGFLYQTHCHNDLTIGKHLQGNQNHFDNFHFQTASQNVKNVLKFSLLFYFLKTKLKADICPACIQRLDTEEKNENFFHHFINSPAFIFAPKMNKLPRNKPTEGV